MDHTFLIPVRTSAAGTLALRIGRLGSGERVGLAFTSEASLTRTLGPSQQWIRLAREALTDMLAPLGIEHITIDPDRVGESCTDGPPPQSPSPGHLQAVAAAA
jgi:type III secretion system (T3SS) SseB-like protein